MAIRAVLLVKRRTARRFPRVDGVRILRRFLRHQPLFDAADILEIDGGRCRAGAECRALVALVDPGVVAVPVQLHARARSLQPDRGEIGGRIFFRLGNLVHWKVEDHLGRVERVDAPRTPGRLVHHERKASGEHQQPFAHQRDGNRINQIAVDEIEVAALRLNQPARFRNDEFRGKLRIGGAGEKEFLETHDVELHGRHAEIDARLFLRCIAHRAGVANGTVEESPVYPGKVPL